MLERILVDYVYRQPRETVPLLIVIPILATAVLLIALLLSKTVVTTVRVIRAKDRALRRTLLLDWVLSAVAVLAPFYLATRLADAETLLYKIPNFTEALLVTVGAIVPACLLLRRSARAKSHPALAALFFGAASLATLEIALRIIFAQGFHLKRAAVAGAVAGFLFMMHRAAKPTWRAYPRAILYVAVVTTLVAIAMNSPCANPAPRPGVALWLAREDPVYSVLETADGQDLFFTEKNDSYSVKRVHIADRSREAFFKLGELFRRPVELTETNEICVTSLNGSAPQCMDRTSLTQTRALQKSAACPESRLEFMALDATHGRLYAIGKNPEATIAAWDSATGAPRACRPIEAWAAGHSVYDPATDSLFTVENRHFVFPGIYLFQFDGADLSLRRKVYVGPYSYGIALDESGRRLYVARLLAGRVEILDADTLARVGHFDLQAGIRELVFDRGFLYVGNYVRGTVTRIDTRTGSVLATYHAGCGVRGLAVSADGKRLWAGSTRGVTRADLETPAR